MRCGAARGAWCAAVVACAVSCTGFPKQPDPGPTWSRDKLDAIDRVTAAHCELRRTCRHDSSELQACVDQHRLTTAKDLQLSRCSGPVSSRMLEYCVRGVQSEPCAKELENVSRIEPCTVGSLCVLGRP